MGHLDGVLQQVEVLLDLFLVVVAQVNARQIAEVIVTKNLVLHLFCTCFFLLFQVQQLFIISEVFLQIEVMLRFILSLLADRVKKEVFIKGRFADLNIYQNLDQFERMLDLPGQSNSGSIF